MARPRKNTEPGTGLASLTAEEEKFIWFLDVAQMPAAKAAEMVGLKNPAQLLQEQHILHYREVTKRSLQSRSQITREDCLEGFKEAIDHARLLGKPEVMIAGWNSIVKMLGYDAPKKIDININTGEVAEVERKLKSVPLAELIEMSGGSIMDADFIMLENK